MTHTNNPKLELVTLGDELLLGLYPNGHLEDMGEELTRRGLAIECNSVIQDDPAKIVAHFSQIWERADIVITTGGLGPTSDDNTREAICDCLGLELEFDLTAEKTIDERFKRLGRTVNTRQRKECYKPKGSELLPNRLGTAPGIYLKHDNKLLIMLPGPSHEMRYMFIHELLPRLVSEGLTSECDAFIQLRTFGIPEGQIENHLKPILKDYDGIGLAFCTHKGLVDIRLSPGKGNHSIKELQRIANDCQEQLGDDFVCIGNASLAEIVGNQMRAMEKTLATAESCTGGLLSHAFTNMPGASIYFNGGVCCYSNDSKVELLEVPEIILQQHGAVSDECAVAMATGVAEKFGADYGLSVTGYAGPDGGTAENPVGTIYIGYHSPIGAWAQKIIYPGNRQHVQARAVNGTLDLMRRKLQKYQLVEFICMETGAI